MRLNKTIVKTHIFLLSLIIGFTACKNEQTENSSEHSQQSDSIAYALIETSPVSSRPGEDAADDPAIWYNAEKPEESLIIGTNKKAGLLVYNLQGEELFFTPVGKVNNVDLRYSFELNNGEKADIVGATNRTDNSLTLMKIEHDSVKLSNIAARKIFSTVGEVYGFTFYRSPVSGKYYAFVGGKEGETEQYELFPTEDNKIDAKLVRTFNFGSQTEGMVADDELGYLYVGEENCCIWKINAEPNADQKKQKVFMSDTMNSKISFDIEGLTIYYASNNKGYLVASIQGNYSYAIFERGIDNKYLGSFFIKDTNDVDGAEETDGLDVLNLALNENFPNGMLVVQDGFNYDNDSLKNQNFKLIPWENIANLMRPALITDNEFNVHLK